jgi:hypothetical protein
VKIWSKELCLESLACKRMKREGGLGHDEETVGLTEWCDEQAAISLYLLGTLSLHRTQLSSRGRGPE